MAAVMEAARIRGRLGSALEGMVVVEVKCVERLGNEHAAQCLNYLRASGMKVYLLVNFQRPKVEWKRILLT